MSHSLPVMACARSDEACCDCCPHGSSCVNGWWFNLCLKRQFQGLWNKESGKWEAVEVLVDRGFGPLGRVHLQMGVDGGNLRWFKWQW